MSTNHRPEPFYFTKNSIQGLRHRLELKQLAFERAMDRWDIHDAGIACAHIDYYKREIARLENSPWRLETL